MHFLFLVTSKSRKLQTPAEKSQVLKYNGKSSRGLAKEFGVGKSKIQNVFKRKPDALGKVVSSESMR